jgi:hypothetical protein
MERLQGFSPRLVGTFPIGLQVEGSDLDIICEVYDFEAFKKQVRECFSLLEGFSLSDRFVKDIRRCVAQFELAGCPVELFGQSIPAEEQNGYRHMIVEGRLLALFGEELKQRVISLKRSGIKTEPAFASVLQLEGDPYEEILKLYSWSDESLSRLTLRNSQPGKAVE